MGPSAGDVHDNGNDEDSDACVGSCMTAVCGDGFVQAGVEGCDEGPGNGGMTCDEKCILTSCGNGTPQAGEECDDNNTDNSDACLDTCFMASCGDGYIRTGVEKCDAGWYNAAIGCVDDCQKATPITAIEAGAFTTCAIIAGGGLRCWGRNAECQLGLGDQAAVGDDEDPSAAPSLDLGDLVTLQVAPGSRHTCALFKDGTVRCWGANYGGQLGYADALPRGCDPATTPAQLPAVQIWDGDEYTEQLAAGDSHTCALSNKGRVRCWGSNFWGAIGYPNVGSIGTKESPVSVDPVVIGGEAVAVVASNQTTCAILVDGAVRCWGGNFWGSLGYGHYDVIGNDEQPASAGDIDLPAPATAVVPGFTHTCALLTTDELHCWGSNFAGELGLGKQGLPIHATPRLVTTGTAVTELGLGSSLTCARLIDGLVRCWGTGAEGQLANGTGLDFGLEAPAANALDVAFDLDPAPALALAVSNGHACAQVMDGSVRCWGASGEGQTGRGQTANIGDNPEELPLSTPVFLFPP